MYQQWTRPLNSKLQFSDNNVTMRPFAGKLLVRAMLSCAQVTDCHVCKFFIRTSNHRSERVHTMLAQSRVESMTIYLHTLNVHMKCAGVSVLSNLDKVNGGAHMR